MFWSDLLRAEKGHGSDTLTLEEVLTSPEWIGLTQATPLQRAGCRIADGLPIDDLVRQPLVPNLERYPDEVIERATWDWTIGEWHGDWKPLELYWLAGIRGGKSLISVANAIKASQTVGLDGLRSGERPLFPILSLSIKVAQATYDHLLGACQSSPRVRELVTREPTATSVFLRHPDGVEVELCVVAGKKAGGSLVGRWLAGGVFDEAARMVGAEEGVVNLDDSRRAALERLLPGGQLWYISSPWAPMGPVYKATQEYWRSPSDRTVVIRAPGPAMNFEQKWTPEATWRIRKSDYRVYVTDCLAEFGDQETGWLTEAELQSVTRAGHEDLECDPAVTYVAVMDPATLTNAWTLVVAGMYPGNVRRVASARQWIPSHGNPLDSRTVFAEIASVCRKYRVDHVYSDQFAPTLLRERAYEFGLGLIYESVGARQKVDEMGTFCDLVKLKATEIPNHPDALDDLKRTRRVLTQNGVTVRLPTTSDGRHCDFQPSLTRAVAKAVFPPQATLAPPKRRRSREEQDELDAKLEEQRGATKGWRGNDRWRSRDPTWR